MLTRVARFSCCNVASMWVKLVPGQGRCARLHTAACARPWYGGCATCDTAIACGHRCAPCAMLPPAAVPGRQLLARVVLTRGAATTRLRLAEPRGALSTASSGTCAAGTGASSVDGEACVAGRAWAGASTCGEGSGTLASSAETARKAQQDPCSLLPWHPTGAMAGSGGGGGGGASLPIPEHALAPTAQHVTARHVTAST